MSINSFKINCNDSEPIYEILFSHYKDRAVSIAKIGNVPLEGFLYAQIHETIQGNFFDIIVNNSTVGFEDQIAFIKESTSLLKNGGVLLIENAIYNEENYTKQLEAILNQFIFNSFIISAKNKTLVLIKKNEETFDEVYYLENNEDVAQAVKNNQFTSGFDHWLKHGKKEKRRTHSQCRYDIINHLINKRNYQSYLEIGVADCSTFNRINLEDKIGVDVVYCPCPILIMPSDEFFKINKRSFDIVFIDGLHTEKQVKKDIENSIKSLNPNGIIVLHDCLPPDEWHAREKNDGGSWNGTTWKAVLRYFNSSNYNCYIVDADWGCGIIDTSKNELNLKYTTLPDVLTFNPWANYLKKNYAISEKSFFNT